MKLIGDDFRAARTQWLYGGRSSQQLRTILVAFFLLLLLQLFLPVLPLLLNALARGFYGPLFATRNASNLAVFAAMIPTSLLVSWLAYVFSGADRADSRQALNLRNPDLGWLGWFAVVAGFVVTTVLFMVVIKLLLQQLGTTGEVEQAVGDVKEIKASLLVVPLAIAFTVPLAEEFLFRGLLFSRLRTTALGNWGGALVSSGMWAVVHTTEPWVNILVIFLMGMLLCALLLRFGSLLVTIVCHCAWNAMTVLAIFGLVSQ